MGNLLNREKKPPIAPLAMAKRKRSDLDSSEDTNDICGVPARKKITSCSNYIYQTLFVEGEGSDVTLDILGITWKLHKLYLKQSKYFNTMFSTRWNQNQSNQQILIVDENITIEAIRITLGSMYKAEVFIPRNLALNVFATASFFQLDGLATAATSVLIETVSKETVVKCHDMAIKYNIETLKKATLSWLLVNMTSAFLNSREIVNISVELMLQLVEDEKLFIVNSEINLYLSLKYWFYLKVTQPDEPLGVNSFFPLPKERLTMLMNADMVKIFSSIHLANLMLHPPEMDLVISDGLFPEHDLVHATQSVLHNIFLIDLQIDNNVEMVSDEIFNKHCLRFGRRLDKQEDGRITTWRWHGFKFGMNLHFSFNNTSVAIKWSTVAGKMLNNCPNRRILYRMKIASSLVEYVNIPITSISLRHDTQILLATFEEPLNKPVMLSFHVLLASPCPQ